MHRTSACLHAVKIKWGKQWLSFHTTKDWNSLRLDTRNSTTLSLSDFKSTHKRPVTPQPIQFINISTCPRVKSWYPGILSILRLYSGWSNSRRWLIQRTPLLWLAPKLFDRRMLVDRSCFILSCERYSRPLGGKPNMRKECTTAWLPQWHTDTHTDTHTDGIATADATMIVNPTTDTTNVPWATHGYKLFFYNSAYNGKFSTGPKRIEIYKMS